MRDNDLTQDGVQPHCVVEQSDEQLDGSFTDAVLSMCDSPDPPAAPSGADPFGVRWLETQHIKATIPTKSGARSPIRVRGAISFDATAAWLWYDLARTVEASHGMVKLHRGARLADARTAGNDIVGALVMNDGSGVPGEPAEMATPVRVPCSALGLGVDYDEFDGPVSGDGTWWQTRDVPARIQLRARPDPNAAALVVAAHAGSSVPLVFARLEVRGSWMRVTRAGACAAVTGWAPVAELDLAPKQITFCRSSRTLQRSFSARSSTGCRSGSGNRSTEATWLAEM